MCGQWQWLLCSYGNISAVAYSAQRSCKAGIISGQLRKLQRGGAVSAGLEETSRSMLRRYWLAKRNGWYLSKMKIPGLSWHLAVQCHQCGVISIINMALASAAWHQRIAGAGYAVRKLMSANAAMA